MDVGDVTSHGIIRFYNDFYKYSGKINRSERSRYLLYRLSSSDIRDAMLASLPFKMF